MATARLEAKHVKIAASKLIDQSEAERIKLRDEWIAKKVSQPVTTGAFWWRSERYRTRAEVVALYEEDHGFMMSEKYWVEYTSRVRSRGANRLLRMAAASIESGDGYLTLDHSDVELLGLSSEQPKNTTEE